MVAAKLQPVKVRPKVEEEPMLKPADANKIIT